MLPDLHVLLVEDDPAVRFAHAQTLKLAGLEVDACASAEAALEKLHPLFPGQSREPPDEADPPESEHPHQTHR
jgi:ActR/RegA family two-component response regulator